MTDHAHVKVQDAAIERHSLMREDQYKYFRWTRRTLRVTFWGVFVIPAGLYLTIHATQNKWNWTGKRRNQPLAKS
ncbi:hypothetical protein C8R43DRAFT_1132914 [Mycena crocata]|nr:hypothetical protein C8R43DRAFT_1132914 [Mycena crocata]